MTVTISGTSGITTPGVNSTASNTLGDNVADTLNVGNGTIVTDTSGNVGIGAVPLTSLSGYKALDVGAAGNGFVSGTNDNYLSTNAYYSSGWKYAAGFAASQYQQTDGRHVWSTAGAGSAGGAISWQERMRIESSGLVSIPAAYSSTTGNAANVNVDSAGNLQRSTSSARYKNSIEDAVHGLAEVLKLRPVTYKGNNNGDAVFGGLIAEEVDEAGLNEFVQYDDEGRPDALAYGNMVSLCIKAIQELKAEVDALKGAK